MIGQRTFLRTSRVLADLTFSSTTQENRQPRSFASDITNDQFDQTLKTNLYALCWITKAAQDHLKPGAAIINAAPVQAFEPSQSPAGLRYDEGRDCGVHQSTLKTND
jgi:NAD(P)-dependent dehydrogenase (short-subunit alcohol dehydrogenase family)